MSAFTTQQAREARQQQAVDRAFGQICSNLGPGPWFRGGREQGTSILRTGIEGLDALLPAGGLLRGSLLEVYGPESSGKSSLVLAVAAHVQQQGGLVAYFDTERMLVDEQAATLGIDLRALAAFSPDSLEDSREIARTLFAANFDLLIVDTATALTTAAERRRRVTANTDYLRAQYLAEFQLWLWEQASESGTAVVIVNQQRFRKVGSADGVFREDSSGGSTSAWLCRQRLALQEARLARPGVLTYQVGIPGTPPALTLQHYLAEGKLVGAVR